MFFVAIPLIGLVLIGAISPLLTFTALFQQKEWRMDRLREHLRREGWWNQLVGRLRLVFIALYIALYLPSYASVIASDGGGGAFIIAIQIMVITCIFLVVFALLSVIQILMRKQRMPIWTSKAVLLVATSILLHCIVLGIAWGRMPLDLLSPAPLLVVLQPFFMLLSWILWKPIDVILKKRVMDKAIHLRSQMQNATVIGIAGSVGKTTVKELIAHLLQDLKPIVTPSHVNTEMGVAQWIINNHVKTQNLASLPMSLLIVEMGAYRKGEIALLCRIAQPTIGVMTALGSDHLALFGSEQNIIEANGELISSLPKDGHAFFYGNNEGCKELAQNAPCPVTIAEAASYVHPLHGRHNQFNVSLAVAVAKHMDIKEERIAELLKSLHPQAHTFSVKQERGVTILDDTYNISPLSFGAALDWAADRTERPRVLLTSGLQETGSDEMRFVQELGAKASMCIERVIFTDTHGSDIFAKAFGKPVEILGAQTERVQAGSVLLAVGRMPLSTINHLLPRVAEAPLS